ncbi:MAG: PAS domain-containing protein [Planctomycetes bacterium]|nr:PAS domain-containing protein [Planctomycetota bacterium]
MPLADAPLVPIAAIVLASGSGSVALLAEFLACLTPGTGMAYIVATTFDDQERARLLAAAAGYAVPVQVASDGQAIDADCVYLPADSQPLGLTKDGNALLRVATSDGHPTDTTLAAIVAACGECAAAVILSADARDGIRGARAIKEAGGLVLLREQSRPSDGVVHSLFAAGLADQSLPMQDMSASLAAFVQQNAVTATPPGPSLERIIELIKTEHGVDFAEYKKSTLVRRVQRRVSIVQAASLEDYVDLLHRSADERSTLFRELLINVTRFFRDPEVWKTLRERIMPELLGRRQDQLRAWVAGCSTGEEAYSLAILFREAMDALKVRVPVKIFATDLDREAVEFASRAVYPASTVADVPAELLERHFVRKGDCFQVAKATRELVVFAPHNLAKDPPFYHIDLVTCRNLLIYLQPALQRRVLSICHFALDHDGYLLLGGSETVSELSPFYAVVDSKAKLYQKKPGRPVPLPLDQTSERYVLRQSPPRAASKTGDAGAIDLADHIVQAALAECVPAALVVNEDQEVVHSFGPVDRFLKLPTGKPSFAITKMAPRELALALGTGIRRVFTDRTTIVYDDLPGKAEADSRSVRLTIKPLPLRDGVPALALIVFENGVARRAEPFHLDAQANHRIRDLEHELEQTSANLQAAIEELETSNEELQATNEEVLAANEELQATNEELQSVNQELYTVNAENQSRIAELTELNNDILNFLSGTNIGTIFLDQRLCIRKFTPAITKQINLTDADIGRPLGHFTHNILYANLVVDAEEVLKTLIPKHREVRSKTGQWFQLRLMPYRTEDNVIKGVVLTFIDISEVKSANDNLRKLMAAVEQSNHTIMITDASGVIEYVNRSFCEISGYASADVVGLKPNVIKSEAMDDQVFAALWRTISSGARWEGRLTNRAKDGRTFCEDAVIVPMLDGEGRITNYLKTAVLVLPARG